jgi:hypothetical protein
MAAIRPQETPVQPLTHQSERLLYNCGIVA